MRLLNCFLFLFLSLFTWVAWATIPIAAAENTYAQIAEALGGQYVHVIPLMSRVNQDPHLFSAGTEQAKALADANIVVFNGLGYDMWVESLLKGVGNKKQIVIEVAALDLSKKDNPHCWYDPHTILLYAAAMTTALKKEDPAHAMYFDTQLQTFLKEYKRFQDTLLKMKENHQGKAIIMTEPLFEPLARYVGLKVLGNGFAKNMMNETSPTPTQIAEFEDALKKHKAQVLIYNVQMISPLVDRMKMIAKENHIPVVGISETQPLNQSYSDWMESQLKKIDEALDVSH